MDDIVHRLRQRMRRGLFSTISTMEEAATQIETMTERIQELEAQNEKLKFSYQFVMQQWMAERLISDNLYAELISCSSGEKSNYMKEYEKSRQQGTITF